MELKLNIYNKQEIVKTYTSDTYDLMFGTVEDILEVLNVDQLKTGSDTELFMLVAKALPKSMSTIKSLLKDVFEGITDEDLKHTKVKELVAVLVTIVKSSFDEMAKGATGKN